ncbi:MAG: AraC family transcriptional regulator [Kiritimatiellales bacterium]
MDPFLLKNIESMQYGHMTFREHRISHLKNLFIPHCGHTLISSSRYHFNLRTREPGQSIFQYTISGTGKLKRKGVLHTITAEDAFILTSPDISEYYFEEGSNPWHIIFITLKGNIFLPAWKLFIKQYGPVMHIPSSHPILHRAAFIIQQAYAGRINTPEEIAHAASSFGFSFIEYMQNRFANKKIPIGIQRAINFCQANLRKPLTLPQLASIAGCSTWHFAREFKKWTSFPPGQYIEKQRIGHAVELLRYSDKNITEIAAACGYGSANYFARAFRRVTNSSPLEFRHKNIPE